MPPSQAEECEAALKAAPNDLELRCKMLGYFMSNRFIDPAGLQKFHEHVLFTIKTFPDNKIAGSHYAQFDLAIDGRASYDEAKKLWQSQLLAHPDDAAIMTNAANFFAVADKRLSDELKIKLQNI
ncbi:hypothetical protein KF728_01460 [Candidatus Obscuribacterales bacterium]|nr:hypothetical protein [Candidatus Obscuribacterales bacterium]